MKIELICVGKTDEAYIKRGIEDYISRISRYIKFEIKELPVLKRKSKISEKELKKNETKIILNNINLENEIILLDERGKQMDSIGFSKYIEKKLCLGRKTICFVIGGAYGFSENIYNLANDIIALSKMTFSHQLIRLIFIEQLYRAFTIIKGQAYHHV